MSIAGSVQYLSQDVAIQLRAVAEQLERGQAETPLADQANALIEPPDSSISIVLLGLHPEARTAALTWLVGPQHHSISIKLSEPLDILDVCLQERGYSLETDSEGRLDFETPESFASALSATENQSTDLAEPIRMALAAPLPLRNLQIVVVRDSATVLRTPDLLGRLVSRAPVLMIAAAGDYDPTPNDIESIRMLSELIAGVWPVFLGTMPERPPSWLPVVAASKVSIFPPNELSEGGSFMPDFIIRGPSHPIRMGLSTIASAERASRLLDMIQERFETDLRQLQSRQKREARLERSADAASTEQDLKLLFDRCKLQLTDDFNKLMQSLREGNRRSLLKSGELAQNLDRLLSSLQPTDLEHETSSKSIHLTLKQEVLLDFRRRLAKVLRQQVDEDCVVIRDCLEETRRAAEVVLADTGSVNKSLALTPPDNRSLWEPLAEMLDLDIKYRGEIPRRGFMQRLGEGRRVVFVALMALSLVGSFVGFNIRQAAWAGIVFLILFVGVVAYTFKSWQREEDETLNKEIERVRESVAAEFNRVLNEVLREKQSRLQQTLDEIKREALTKLDSALREAQLSKAQATESERRDARSKLKLIDQRLKELNGLNQQITKLRQMISDWAVRAKEDLSKLLTRPSSKEVGA